MNTIINYYKKYQWWILAVMLVILLWGANLTYYFYCKSNTVGQFGDVFGAVNALFSGLAFAGIIISIRMQSQELKLQRDELALQRNELEETRKVFNQQSEIMEDQRNDATFFNLLSNHRQMIDSLRTSKPRFIGKSITRSVGTVQEPVSGYEVVDGIADSWIKYFRFYSSMYSNKEILEFDNVSLNPIQILDNNTELITIFNEILNVYDFINNRFTDNKKRKFYHDTLWTNLSYAEKFIFESFLFNFPEHQKNRNHKTEIYEDYQFLDFQKYSIPEISLKRTSYHSKQIAITLECNCNINRMIFFTHIKNHESKLAQVMHKSEIKKISQTSKQDIVLNNLITLVNPEIQALPYKNSKLLSNYEYGLFIEFLHQNEIFQLCVEINLSSNCNQTADNKTECFPVFNGNGILIIADEFRSQIISQIA